MTLDKTSMAIGIGIGVAIVTAAMILFVLQYGRGNGLDLDTDAATPSAPNHNASYYVSGMLKEITAKEMLIDQTYSITSLQDSSINPSIPIKLEKGAVFTNCREGAESRHSPESCATTITADELAKGIHVCALVHTYGDGVLYGGRIWLDSGCAPFQNEITAREHIEEEQ